MERYSLIIVADETAPIRRFDIRKQLVQRAVWGAAVAALILLVGLVDYVRVRLDHGELAVLRLETTAQREKIEAFEQTIDGVSGRLARLQDFERKVRIIANLPGSAATGGTEISEVGNTHHGDLETQATEAVRADSAAATLDTASESRPVPAGGASGATPDAAESPARASAEKPGDADVSLLREEAVRLGLVAENRETSLKDLVDALEAKRDRLASSPAIWPTKGWLTSRFGHRVSPFTGQKQFHAGIDIAGARGTDVIAPARGRVSFSGKRGPLGQSVIIDHGHGVRTMYGHNDDLYVKRGEQVERGQRISSIGSSGRSTGPHLHYVVEIDGKARNPLNYIFD